jgi:prolyl oligopeptidase
MTGHPPATRREDVVDVLHGVEVADPYRWLEDGDEAEVADWVAAQNAFTRGALDARADRPWWHERLVALMQLPVVLAVQVRGEHVFCLERPAGAEQFLLTRRSAVSPDAEPVVLLDPAVGVVDAANAIDWFEASDNGALVAVGTSEGGTENSVLRVLDTTDGRDLGEAIPNTRACSVAWEPDGSGFAYTRYPEGDEYHRTVHHHRLGADWLDDPVVWAEHPDPQAWPDVAISPDGERVLVHVLVGWARYDIHLLDRRTGEWSTLIGGVEATSELLFAQDGESFVGVTTLDAPKGRLVRVPFGTIDPAQWETLVPEGEPVLSRPAVCGEEVLAVSTLRALDRIVRFGADGSSRGSIEGVGDVVAIVDLTADRDTGRAFAVVDSFDSPTAAWRVDPGAVAARWFPAAADVDTVPSLSVRQVTYPSADGTSIGLFLIHRDDVVPGPEVPLILNGYGGFAITETPVWSPQIAAWCVAGGVYAIAGLRGGLEEGEDWHRAGRRAHKQNVFDDFHAAADWLVEEGLAARDRLAILGRSNGGLLVGAALTQRPDLCRAVWCGVPLLDMVRFPQFLIARLWTDEYGDPDVAEEFAWLYAYSPYHRVVEGTDYPATLFSTAEGDTRVDPLHARKMAALLQAASTGQDEHPILLYQEGRAGHGVGKPVAKRADELADGLTFLAWQVGLVPATEPALRS